MKNSINRLHSLDALRGFDMFFIIGGAELVKAICTLFPSSVSTFFFQQMEHVDWHGFAFYDMIFPLFLFIAGVSFPFSLVASITKGKSRQEMLFTILKRGLKLVLLGFIFNDFLAFNFDKMRYASVLGRIGIAWAIGAILYLYGGKRVAISVGILILVGYYFLCTFVPSPTIPEGSSIFSIEGSIVTWFDLNYLPGRCLEATHDPLGLLSTLPAISTAILGMITGSFLMESQKSESKKVIYMATVSILLVVGGLFWDLIFPINKKLWSSSYVLFAGGLSLMLLTLFYWIIDVMKYRKWSFVFTVIGLNSITIYMAQKIIKFTGASKFLFGGTVSLLPEFAQPIAAATAYLCVVWVFLYFLYRKKIFLKV